MHAPAAPAHSASGAPARQESVFYKTLICPKRVLALATLEHWLRTCSFAPLVWGAHSLADVCIKGELGAARRGKQLKRWLCRQVEGGAVLVWRQVHVRARRAGAARTAARGVPPAAGMPRLQTLT